MQSHFSSHFLYPSSTLQSLCSPFFHTSGLSCMSPDVVPICDGWHNCWHNPFQLDQRPDRASRESQTPPWCAPSWICLSVLSVLSVAIIKETEFFFFLCLFFRQLLELFQQVCVLQRHIGASVFRIVCADSWKPQNRSCASTVSCVVYENALNHYKIGTILYAEM